MHRCGIDPMRDRSRHTLLTTRPKEVIIHDIFPFLAVHIHVNIVIITVIIRIILSEQVSVPAPLRTAVCGFPAC
jgi:hypothetical protein